jgi:hypothetical protein
MKAPVLLMTYKKHESLEEILNIVNEYNPPCLYISRNLSRNEQDRNYVKQVEKTINNFSFKCKTVCLNNQKHLPINESFFTALNYVFSLENELIILEDDTIPDTTFFNFCNTNLAKYGHDSTVGCIIGTNLNETTISNSSLFVDIGLPFWGWATWSNRWKQMPESSEFWKEFISKENKTNIINEHPNCFKAFFRHSEKYITWDLNWSMFLFSRGMKCIIPGINLITNVGYNPKATFTKNMKSKFSNLRMSTEHFSENSIEIDSDEARKNYYKSQELFIYEFEIGNSNSSEK